MSKERHTYVKQLEHIFRQKIRIQMTPIQALGSTVVTPSNSEQAARAGQTKSFAATQEAARACKKAL